jgi:hypothetical protein
MSQALAALLRCLRIEARVEGNIEKGMNSASSFAMSRHLLVGNLRRGRTEVSYPRAFITLFRYLRIISRVANELSNSTPKASSISWNTSVCFVKA